jgi:hypothetical protein
MIWQMIQISSVPSFPMMHADAGLKDKKSPTIGIASTGTVACSMLMKITVNLMIYTWFKVIFFGVFQCRKWIYLFIYLYLNIRF